MIRFVLVIGLGMLAAGAAHANCPTVNGFPDITSNVYTPSSPYDPTPGPGYQSPNTCGTLANGSTVQQAFALANSTAPSLQKDLCDLQCIFVIPSQPSFGKWEDPNQPSGHNAHGSNHAFVGINTNDLTQTMIAKQNQNLTNLGLNQYATHDDASSSYSQRISLLYTLAHEMGHIKWRRAISTGSGKITDHCRVDDFIGYSWSDPGGITMKRWVGVSDELGQRKNNVLAPSQINDPDALYTAYTLGMVTAFGDLNAAEDFAEAYAIQAVILVAQSLSYQLNITINGKSPITVTSNNRGNATGNSVLTNKFACLPLP